MGFTPVPLKGESAERDRRLDAAAASGQGEPTADEIANQVVPQVIRIVSDPDVESVSSGVLNAATLRDALAMAQKNNVNVIEIAMPELVSEPVKLQVEDLWIRSTASGGTVIRFEVGNTADTVRESMLDVGSGMW